MNKKNRVTRKKIGQFAYRQIDRCIYIYIYKVWDKGSKNEYKYCMDKRADTVLIYAEKYNIL